MSDVAWHDLRCHKTNCACRFHGFFRPECGSEKYRNVLDRLTKEFGADAIRISTATDYGQTQKMAICADWETGERFVIWPLVGPYPCEQEGSWPRDGDRRKEGQKWGYDLNDHPEDVERLIEIARIRLRGFGA